MRIPRCAIVVELVMAEYQQVVRNDTSTGGRSDSAIHSQTAQIMINVPRLLTTKNAAVVLSFVPFCLRYINNSFVIKKKKT